MDQRMISVPLSRLLDPQLTASAKVIWIALQHHPSATRSEIGAQTGLLRNSITRGLAQLKSRTRAPSGPIVKVPAHLLADRNISAYAKVLYALLQATSGFRGHDGQFTYRALRTLTGLGITSMKRAIAELADANWIQVSQKSRVSPIHFKIGSPEWRRSRAAAYRARRRLKQAEYGGEALMREYLSLLIDSDRFTDNAEADFLVNPITGGQMHFDRYYPPNVAFEYHGEQHFRATERFSQNEVDAQRLRDLIKAGICFYERIHLVVVQAADLSLQGMIEKVGTCLPLRDLTGQGPLIAELEDVSILYQAGVPPTGR